MNEENFVKLKERTDKRNSLLSKFAVKDLEAIRRQNYDNSVSVYRTQFIVDVDRIIHNLFYNRYVDKTQVFSLYKNDDITRRGMHIQYVSRIARTIGQALGLNIDLIEAIALGHDIGHTPFGHKGEEYLNAIYYKHTRRFFNHNVHSVRVLDILTKSNLTLQTLDGILAHNGELPASKYIPSAICSFQEFDQKLERCYTDTEYMKKITPCTLEGCVVRVSDIIAYLGKDRQDALKAFGSDFKYEVKNRDIIRRITDSIIACSLDKDYIAMDNSVYNDMQTLMRENYELIYNTSKIVSSYDNNIKPMFEMLYEKFLDDLMQGNKESYIFKHHIEYAYISQNYEKIKIDFNDSRHQNDIVADYLASMTDDYFIELFGKLFPGSQYKINYVPYF